MTIKKVSTKLIIFFLWNFIFSYGYKCKLIHYEDAIYDNRSVIGEIFTDEILLYIERFKQKLLKSRLR